jgi:hypothetical protein
MHGHFKQEGWLTWGGSVARGDDGLYHMYVSRWPLAEGHNAWVTHSEIAHAVASDPTGPYEFRDVALGRREPGMWDADVAHNPTVFRWQGKYYLYYTGNHGDGSYWDHRNHQRVGVAVSDSPDGPWLRQDEPLLEVTPGAWDSLVTTNPSCTPTPDGRFLLMYKAVGHERELPMGGPVLHGVAFSDSPTGPFVKHPEPIFVSADAWFPGEDPFTWAQDGRYYAILKDQGSNYSPEERALVLFESDDGKTWSPAAEPVVTPRRVRWADGTEVEYHRVERPQVLLEDGKPTVLFVAVKPTKEEHDSFNIHIPLAD